MKEITLEDLQELGQLLKVCRPMTEQEIANFGVVPEGAIKYPDYKSYRKALSLLGGAYDMGCNQEEGLFWIRSIR